MPIAAVPKYLGTDFQRTSPGMRFGMYLPIWTERADQEHEVRKRAEAKSKEGQEVQNLLRQGMDHAIRALCQRQHRPLPSLWDKNDFAARHAWSKVTKLSPEDKGVISALLARQRAAFAAQPSKGHALEAVSIAPFTTGLGNAHPLENGFAFWNPYGLPYLPGSGVKGVLRQGARELADGLWNEMKGWSTIPCYHLIRDNKPVLDNQNQPVVLSMLDVLFGRETPEGESDHVRGALAFWDVIPQIAGDSLMVEIMTPHQSHYYQQKKEHKSGDSVSPHDSGQPTPISFLTVPPGSTFVFHVVCDEDHLRRLTATKIDGAPDLLAEEHGQPRWKALIDAAFTHAFDWLGFGAKTAVGYGAMKRTLSGSGQTTETAQQQTAVTPQSRWVEEKLRELCSKPGTKPDDALRSKNLAEAVQAIDDPTLRREALRDIMARWKAKGWWEKPTGGSAKKAKAIYDELLAQEASTGE